jgi:predicted ArsR family transcriptional regulator
MLESIFGSRTCERVLIFLFTRDEGYAREIARFYDIGLASVQKQLEKLEAGGVLYSKLLGRTRLYGFNPRYPFRQELRGLLEKALSFYPEDLREELVLVRRRPRRKGKPL